MDRAPSGGKHTVKVFKLPIMAELSSFYVRRGSIYVSSSVGLLQKKGR
jgi:hypothetical protein